MDGNTCITQGWISLGSEQFIHSLVSFTAVIIACEQAHLLARVAEPHPRAGKAGEKSGARKSEPASEPLIFEFPAFADKRSDPIG